MKLNGFFDVAFGASEASNDFWCIDVWHRVNAKFFRGSAHLRSGDLRKEVSFWGYGASAGCSRHLTSFSFQAPKLGVLGRFSELASVTIAPSLLEVLLQNPLLLEVPSPFTADVPPGIVSPEEVLQLHPRVKTMFNASAVLEVLQAKLRKDLQVEEGA